MKAHIANSPEPLREGSDIQAICGHLVKNVVFAYMFDTGIAPEFLGGMTTINTCKDCFRIPLSNQYVYGLLPGAEIRPKHEEKEVEVAA